MKRKFLPLSVETVQEHLFELLRTVDSVCRQNEIPYWIDGGTLLGAVRNGGFIPWDDDLDICLMKHDYDRLLKCLEKEVGHSSRFFLFYYGQSNMSFWSECFGTGALLIKDYHGRIFPCKIDISPMKSIKREFEIQDRVLTEVARSFICGGFKLTNQQMRRYRYLGDVELLRYKKAFLDFFNEEYMTRNSCPVEGSLINYSYNDAYSSVRRDYFHFDDIFPLSNLVFNGLSVNAPRKSHEYLSKLYGPTYLVPPVSAFRKPARQFMLPTHSAGYTYDADNLNEFLSEKNKHFINRARFLYKVIVLFKIIMTSGVGSALSAAFGKRGTI